MLLLLFGISALIEFDPVRKAFFNGLGLSPNIILPFTPRVQEIFLNRVYSYSAPCCVGQRVRATVKQFVNQGLEVTVGHNLSGIHWNNSSINVKKSSQVYRENPNEFSFLVILLSNFAKKY